MTTKFCINDKIKVKRYALPTTFVGETEGIIINIDNGLVFPFKPWYLIYFQKEQSCLHSGRGFLPGKYCFYVREQDLELLDNGKSLLEDNFWVEGA